MSRLAPKLNVSRVHPGLIPIPVFFSKDNHMCVKQKICMLKGSSILMPDDSSINLVGRLKKQQMPSILHSQTSTLRSLTHYL